MPRVRKWFGIFNEFVKVNELLDNGLLLAGLLVILQPRSASVSFVSVGGRVVGSMPLTTNVYQISWTGVLPLTDGYPFACCAAQLTNRVMR